MGEVSFSKVARLDAVGRALMPTELAPTQPEYLETLAVAQHGGTSCPPAQRKAGKAGRAASYLRTYSSASTSGK